MANEYEDDETFASEKDEGNDDIANEFASDVDEERAVYDEMHRQGLLDDDRANAADWLEDEYAKVREGFG